MPEDPDDREDVVDLGTIESLDSSRPRTMDLEPGRDKVRAVLALGLTGLMSIVVLCAVAALWLTPEPASLQTLMVYLQTLLSPLFGLVGAATGFYFGASQREDRR